MTNRNRFQKTIFKTVCDFKKDNNFSESPVREMSFDDSLNATTPKSMRD